MKKNIIVELDETQHFTGARAAALSAYPDSLELGFDRDKWIDLCHEIDAHDDYPEYRDEQRAWYDTLRDFLPLIDGYKPTQRIYMGDFQWCLLDENNYEDVKAFKTIISGKQFVYTPQRYWLNKYAEPCKYKTDTKLTVYKGLMPVMARVIAHSWHCGDPDDAVDVLNAIANTWPDRIVTKYLITPGGFIVFPWPDGYIFDDDIWSPKPSNIKKLEITAIDYFRELISNSLLKKLRKHTRYLTLGMDTYFNEEAGTDGYHAELILIIDLITMKNHITGKFYSAKSQKTTLIHHSNLGSHFLNLDGDRVMILGCHDLSVFSPRAIATVKGDRRKRNIEFRKLAKEYDPNVVLQHPHSTDTDRVWRCSWAEMKRELQDVKYYASAFAYFHWGGRQRAPLNRVLEKTKLGETLDFVIT